MLRVISIVFWSYFALSCIVLFAGAVALWLLTLPFDRNGRLLHLYSCFWAAQYLYLNPLWKLRIQGARAVDRRRPFVIVSNHQSFGDILALFATYLPYKWVSKASVFKVPFLGWNMRLNSYVPIVRGDRGSAGRMVETCRRWIARGVSVLMFPEGTRSANGDIQPFKMGAFRIAQEAGCALLPILVDGTGAALPKHGFLLRETVRIDVNVLAPIAIDGYATLEEAAEAVREVMTRELERMRGARAAMVASASQV